MSTISPPASEVLAAPPVDLVRMAEGRVNIRDQEQLVERILDDARAGRGGTVFTLNLDHMVKLNREPRFRAAYQRASYVSADGAPVVVMASGLGEILDRVTGADLVLPLARSAAAAGVPIFLFGTSDEVRGEAGEKLLAEAPNLLIAGSESPDRGFDPEGEAAREAALRIRASGAKICFVALGAPKQELFANLAVCRAPGVIFVCIGAALDFIAGHAARAPSAWQKAGFEWAWRLLQEPRRLAGRYGRSLFYYARYLMRGADDRMFRVERRRGGGGPHSPRRGWPS